MENRVEQLISQARGHGSQSLRATARLMSIMTDQPHRLVELLTASRDWPQPRLVLGITGAPGSGKSTLTDHIALEYRLRYPDRRLGIVAVDPSSPFTGGAILGDRVRMMRHSTDPNVFIRSLASRGHLGGLALGVKGVVRVMSLIGCDLIIVETVGVGQSEIEIAKNADVVIVVLAPGQGDSVQMLKAGLMEVGEFFVVNKADRPEANQLHQQLLSALQTGQMAKYDNGSGNAMSHCHDLRPASSSDASSKDFPPVVMCSASRHEGIGELLEELEQITARNAERWQAEREGQALEEIRQAVLEEIRHRVCHTMSTLNANGTSDGQACSLLDGSKTLECFVNEILRETIASAPTKHDRQFECSKDQVHD